MKKLVFLFALMVGAMAISAQNSKVQSALNYIKPSYYDLDKAKEAIDLACAHEKTMNKAKTWKVKGQVYQAIGGATDEKYKGLSEDPLNEALAAYNKATELDVKGSFKNEITLQCATLTTLFINAGITCFQDEDFACAMKNFEGSIKVDALVDPERVDSMIIFNTAIAADRAGMDEEAIKYYRQTIEIGYEGSKVYNFVANVQKEAGDTVGYLATLQEGIEAYPEDNEPILMELINHYLLSGQAQQALAYLAKAIEKDPTNHTLYFAQGSMYDQLKDSDAATVSYKKCVEIKDDYFDGYYNLGALFFNKGADMLKQANNIPPSEQAKYDAAVVEAFKELEKALPYLEEAHKLKPGEETTLLTLREIYFKLRGDKDEYMTRYNEVKAELDALPAKE